MYVLAFECLHQFKKKMINLPSHEKKYGGTMFARSGSLLEKIVI